MQEAVAPRCQVQYRKKSAQQLKVLHVSKLGQTICPSFSCSLILCIHSVIRSCSFQNSCHGLFISHHWHCLRINVFFFRTVRIARSVYAGLFLFLYILNIRVTILKDNLMCVPGLTTSSSDQRIPESILKSITFPSSIQSNFSVSCQLSELQLHGVGMLCIPSLISML